jgi:penicillin-insensitive murein endopeptidase
MEGDLILAQGPGEGGDYGEFGGNGDTGVVGCTDQRLQDGIELSQLPLFYTLTQPDHSWASAEMASAIVDASRHLRWLMPGADPLTIGDISARHGGFLNGHKSHRGGIDADVGIYHQIPAAGGGLVSGWQDPRGFATPGPGQFDVEANWSLIQAFLDTGKVDMILLDRGHIAALRAYALRAGLLTDEEAEAMFPSEGSRNSWASTGIVRHAPNHTDHIHVRVLCADGSKADAR